MRLIDADKVYKAQLYNAEYREIVTETITAAAILDTVTDEGCEELIELVRCKDCQSGNKTMFFGEEAYDCGKGNGTRKPDWFCADGERKVKDGD
jgi:hypothetical protein